MGNHAKQAELRTQLWGWENWEKSPDVLDAINREIAEQDKPKPAAQAKPEANGAGSQAGGKTASKARGETGGTASQSGDCAEARKQAFTQTGHYAQNRSQAPPQEQPKPRTAPTRTAKTEEAPNARNPFAGKTVSAVQAMETLSGPGLDGAYVAERGGGDGNVARKIRAAAVEVRIPTRLMLGENPVFNLANMRGWNLRGRVNGTRICHFFLPKEADLLRDALKLIEDNYGLAERAFQEEVAQAETQEPQGQEPMAHITKHAIRPVRNAEVSISYQEELIEEHDEPLSRPDEAPQQSAPSAAELTEEQIRNSCADSVTMRNALSYLQGKRNLNNQIAYRTIQSQTATQTAAQTAAP